MANAPRSALSRRGRLRAAPAPGLDRAHPLVTSRNEPYRGDQRIGYRAGLRTKITGQ
jgi:hypothetical protein